MFWTFAAWRRLHDSTYPRIQVCSKSNLTPVPFDCEFLHWWNVHVDTNWVGSPVLTAKVISTSTEQGETRFAWNSLEFIIANPLSSKPVSNCESLHWWNVHVDANWVGSPVLTAKVISTSTEQGETRFAWNILAHPTSSKPVSNGEYLHWWNVHADTNWVGSPVLTAKVISTSTEQGETRFAWTSCVKSWVFALMKCPCGH